MSSESMFDLSIMVACMTFLGAFRLAMSYLERVRPLGAGSVQRLRPAHWGRHMAAIYVLNAVLVVGIYALWHTVDFAEIGLLANRDLGMSPEEHSVGALALGGVLFWLVYSWFDGLLHYWRHCSPTLWQHVHKVHHNDPAMDVSATYWRCWQEILFDTGWLVVIGGLVLGVSWPVLVLGMSLEVVAQLIHHTNFRSPAGLRATLGHIIQLPEHHRYHHARDLHTAYYWTIMPFNVIFHGLCRLFGISEVGIADITDVGERQTGFAEA